MRSSEYGPRKRNEGRQKNEIDEAPP
ncbi:hypothetical protein Gotur_035388 [Gossypium turneri]